MIFLIEAEKNTPHSNFVLVVFHPVEFLLEPVLGLPATRGDPKAGHLVAPEEVSFRLAVEEVCLRQLVSGSLPLSFEEWIHQIPFVSAIPEEDLNWNQLRLLIRYDFFGSYVCMSSYVFRLAASKTLQKKHQQEVHRVIADFSFRIHQNTTNPKRCWGAPHQPQERPITSIVGVLFLEAQ